MRLPLRKPTTGGTGALLLLLGLLVQGCSEDIGGPPSDVDPSFAAVEPEELEQIQAMYAGEADFVEIARQEPSFAGYYLDDGGVVGLTSNGERSSAVADAIMTRIGSALDEPSLPDVQDVRVVQRSFLELARYRNLIHTRLGQIPDIVWLDLDEASNVVSLKVSSSDGEVVARRQAEELEIPSEALDIIVGAPLKSTATLDSRVRPLVGGLYTESETSEENDSGGHINSCTYGFNAVLDGEVVFFTNSHCTRQVYTDDANLSPFHQPGPFGWASREIGEEFEDPGGWSCSGISADPCRYSDAAAILPSVDDDSLSLGYIARTQSKATGGTKGSTTIDSNDPTFEIFGKDLYPSNGQEVNMMGQNGGWNYGDVNQTCATHHMKPTGDDITGADNDFFVVCGYKAEYHSWKGDSGAPVFTISPQGNGVYLTGINFGNDGCLTLCDHGEGLFAPVGGIEQDFGTIAVTPGALQPDATINGPTTAAMWTYCTYDAQVTGGTPPYSYQWSGLASGTGSSISFTVTQGGTLYLQVTDAAMESDWEQIELTLDSSSQSCPL